jgi:hypothetical protein
MSITFQLWFGEHTVYCRPIPKDGKCVFLLLEALKKKLRLPASE